MKLRLLVSYVIVLYAISVADISKATLIGDVVKLNVDGFQESDITVLVTGPEYGTTSFDGSPDEGLSIDFNAYSIDFQFSDGNGGWLMYASSDPFAIIMSDLNVSGFPDGIKGITTSGSFFGSSLNVNLLSNTSIRVWIPDNYSISGPLSSSFQISLSPDPIPEPTTMLLLGTGLVGVAGAARRKKKNQA